jgi:hypothetical protein
VRRATQALSERRVPGAPMLIHKMVEAKYRHHSLLAEAARRHSGLPPYLKPPPGVTPGMLRATPSAPPVLPPPPALVPPPGQSTQLDEAADELLPETDLKHDAPEETAASSEEPGEVNGDPPRAASNDS